MKLILLGKTGMLGSQFLKVLSGNKDFEMFAFDREQFDITDTSKLEDIMNQINPDFVINCCAYTDVDGAESERELAFKVNGEAVTELAKLCNKLHCRLIHFSTDYVFDGRNSLGYEEADKPAPLNEYGKSKLAGEEGIISNLKEYYIIRTSWLYGEHGKNFVDTMLRLAENRSELSVVDDQIGSPTYTNDLVKAVINHFLTPFLVNIPEHHKRFYEKLNTASGKPLPFGIYHLTNSGTTSWFKFAVKIFELSGINIKVKPVSSSEFKRPAPRPKCSILRSTKLLSDMRSWKKALEAYLDLIS